MLVSMLVPRECRPEASLHNKKEMHAIRIVLMCARAMGTHIMRHSPRSSHTGGNLEDNASCKAKSLQ